MLKKVNQLRRSLSKNSVDKQERKEKESNKKKKSNQKVNQSSQTDDTSSSTKQNVNKKLNFTKLSSKKDKSKMNENNKSANSLKVDDSDIPFIGDAESDDDLQDKIVEEPFPKTVRILESENGSKVYLIGTAHFSEESCKDVEYVINRVKPDVVVLEICKERMPTMMLDEKVLMERIKNFSLNQVHEIIKSYGLIQGFIQIMFLYVSKQITEQTGMLPGSEIRKALKESEKIPHCINHFGDRPFHITFKRAIGSLTIYQKFKLALSILFSDPKMSKAEVENYKQNDVLEGYLQELAENYPMMKKALVDERDMFLAYSLQLACWSQFHNNKNEFYTERLKVSRNSLASVEQQLISCKHELENFRKIKSANSSNSTDKTDSQIESYETKLERLENQYNKMHEQVVSDTENLTSFPSQSPNSDHGPSVVVGIVGMGHMNGIQRYFNKVTASDIRPLLVIPEPSLKSIVAGKVIKYSFYGIVIYTCCRYAIPAGVKNSIVDLSLKTVSYSKELINEKLLNKN